MMGGHGWRGCELAGWGFGMVVWWYGGIYNPLLPAHALEKWILIISPCPDLGSWWATNGGVVWWRGGVVAWWRGGVVVQWFSGSAVQWFSVVGWRCGRCGRCMR